jgi:hypothetical protein
MGKSKCSKKNLHQNLFVQHAGNRIRTILVEAKCSTHLVTACPTVSVFWRLKSDKAKEPRCLYVKYNSANNKDCPPQCSADTCAGTLVYNGVGSMSFSVPVMSWNSCLGESSYELAGRAQSKNSEYVAWGELFLAEGEAVSSSDDAASNDDLESMLKEAAAANFKVPFRHSHGRTEEYQDESQTE